MKPALLGASARVALLAWVLVTVLSAGCGSAGEEPVLADAEVPVDVELATDVESDEALDTVGDDVVGPSDGGGVDSTSEDAATGVSDAGDETGDADEGDGVVTQCSRPSALRWQSSRVRFCSPPQRSGKRAPQAASALASSGASARCRTRCPRMHAERQT